MRIGCLRPIGLVAFGLLAACSATPSDGSETGTSNITSPNGNDTLSAGLHHTCALTTEGEIKCWGNVGLSGPDDEDADEALSTITLSNVKIVGKVANADGSFDSKERALLEAALAGRLPDGTTVDTLLAGPFDFAAAIKALAPSAREVAYHASLAVAHADGTVADAERALLDQIAPRALSLGNARIAAAIAQADGTVTDAEKAIVAAALEGITLPDGVTLDSLLAEAIDLGAELANVFTAEAREQVYRTGLAVARAEPEADAAATAKEQAALDKIAMARLMLDGRTTPPEGKFVAVESGWRHSCALASDGAVKCWGDNEDGQLSSLVGVDGTFSTISAGAFHTCGVTKDGAAKCWGRSLDGEANPPTVEGEQKFVAISAGSAHSCGVLSNGTAMCWGANDRSQLVVPRGVTFKSVSAGHDYTCGIKTDDTVVCWGFNDKGQASPPEGTFTSVRASYDHTCGLKTDGNVACWGSNDSGQTEAPPESFLSVTTGWKYSCGIKSDHTPVCWGHDGDEELTTGSTPPSGSFQ